MIRVQIYSRITAQKLKLERRVKWPCVILGAVALSGFDYVSWHVVCKTAPCSTWSCCAEQENAGNPSCCFVFLSCSVLQCQRPLNGNDR